MISETLIFLAAEKVGLPLFKFIGSKAFDRILPILKEQESLLSNEWLKTSATNFPRQTSWSIIFNLILLQRVKIPATAAKVIVDTIFDSMRESLEKGEGIEIRGFGSFVVRHYGAYKGRNPKTGETVDVPPKKLPYFKVGKELKD